MSLVNCVYAGHHKTLLIVLYLMFYSYNHDTKEESYAVAINVPRIQCQGNFDPLNENATDVKNAIYNTKNQFYKGEDLMAAGPWPCDCKMLNNCKTSENCISKSVSLLLQNDSSLTFKNFLKRRENDSCVVIYTVSPCLNMSSGYNITHQTLKTWKIIVELKPLSSRKFMRLIKIAIDALISQKTLQRLFPSIALWIKLLCL